MSFHPDHQTRVRAAIADAEEFVKRGKEFLDCVQNKQYGPNNKLNASMKRKSMDLTRSLAEVRREWRED